MAPNPAEATLPVCTSYSLGERPEGWQERRSGRQKEKVDEAEKMWKENMWVWVKKQNMGVQLQRRGMGCMTVYVCCRWPPLWDFLICTGTVWWSCYKQTCSFHLFQSTGLPRNNNCFHPFALKQAFIIGQTIEADLAVDEVGLSEHIAESYFCLEFLHEFPRLTFLSGFVSNF